MNIEWLPSRAMNIFVQDAAEVYLKPIFYMLLGALLTLAVLPIKANQYRYATPSTELCGSAFNAPSDQPFFDQMSNAMAKMDLGMSAAPMTGNINHDFATMMIPHHQGAIDMAKGELNYGKDPIMRRLAEEIIVDQQSEIDVMNLWLEKHAGTGKGN